MLLDNNACLARLLSIDTGLLDNNTTGLLIHHARLLLIVHARLLLIHPARLLLILTHHGLPHLSGLLLVRYDDLTLLLSLQCQIGSLISLGLPVASSDDAYDDNNAYYAADDRHSNPDHVDPPHSGGSTAVCVSFAQKVVAAIRIALTST